ncbi:MAG: LexA family transcriptional regulator, partial [Flavobacteriales bacterium]
YEEGRAEPKLATLVLMSQFFNVSIDELVLKSLDESSKPKRFQGDSLRVLPISIDKSTERELVTLVPTKAAAGYTAGYGSVEFISKLPSFALPIKELSQDQSYRAFQIDGDSMLPIPSGAYVVASYLEDWSNAGQNKSYIVVTKDDGIVFKRIQRSNDQGLITLISNNTLFDPYTLSWENVVEIWYAKAFMSFDFPTESQHSSAIEDIKLQLQDLKSAVSDLKS